MRREEHETLRTPRPGGARNPLRAARRTGAAHEPQATTAQNATKVPRMVPGHDLESGLCEGIRYIELDAAHRVRIEPLDTHQVLVSEECGDPLGLQAGPGDVCRNRVLESCDRRECHGGMVGELRCSSLGPGCCAPTGG